MAKNHGPSVKNDKLYEGVRCPAIDLRSLPQGYAHSASAKAPHWRQNRACKESLSVCDATRDPCAYPSKGWTSVLLGRDLAHNLAQQHRWWANSTCAHQPETCQFAGISKARPARFERATSRSGGERSIH